MPQMVSSFLMIVYQLALAGNLVCTEVKIYRTNFKMELAEFMFRVRNVVACDSCTLYLIIIQEVLLVPCS